MLTDGPLAYFLILTIKDDKCTKCNIRKSLTHADRLTDIRTDITYKYVTSL